MKNIMANFRENRLLKNAPSIISVILGIVAVFISWQAYLISKETRDVIFEQMRPNVLLADSNHGGISPYLGYQDSHNYVCAQSVRLQNVGGLPTSLVSYDTIISLHNKSIQFSSSLYETLTYTNTDIPPALSSFESAIFTDDLETSIKTSSGDFSQALKLPVQVEAYSSIGLSFATSYILDWSKNPFDKTLDSQNALKVLYKLHFASGQIVEIPPDECQYLK
jgi:hypothetical protein